MTWKRVEAGGIDSEIEQGLVAAVADPLWLLARQWQVGEFRGEDAATPIVIEASVRVMPVTAAWAQGGAPVARGAQGAPLEALVERELVSDGPAADRMALERGAALLCALAEAAVPATFLTDLRAAYPPRIGSDDLDPVGAARLALLARTGLDGAAVLTAVGDDPAALPVIAALDEPLRSTVAGVIGDWAQQEAALFSEEEAGAWSPRRLEYGFGVAAAGGGRTAELAAPDYPGGRLDWHSFDVTKLPAAQGPEPLRPAIRVLATPLQYAGMPASRWWEIEDGDAYIGDLSGGPEDLARSVIAAYATSAGDNWFVVPCTLAAGTLAQVTHLHVTDDFGGRWEVPAAAVLDAAAGARPWRFFELDGDPSPGRGEAPLLFLAPVLDTVQQGRPLEEVEFRRDEAANMAWAIERRVESAAGLLVDREAGPQPPPEPPAAGAWRFQLATDVPDNWVPLVPVRIKGSRPDIVLRRGRIAADAGAHLPRGRILEPERPFVMREEEIPAGGVRVTRRYQLARSADGGVYLWVGRRKSPSGGPMRRTPLRFDQLTTA